MPDNSGLAWTQIWEEGHGEKEALHCGADHPQAPRSGGAIFLGEHARTGGKADRRLDSDADPLAQGIRWPSHGPGEAAEGSRKRKRPAQASLGRCGARQGHPEGSRVGKLLSPIKRRQAVEHVRDAVGREKVSERRACRLLGQSRSTQRRGAHVPDDEPRLVRDMTRLATQYGRYGYRRITELLRREGWNVNHKRVSGVARA